VIEVTSKTKKYFKRVMKALKDLKHPDFELRK
jgi:hypothetical protein